MIMSEHSQWVLPLSGSQTHLGNLISATQLTQVSSLKISGSDRRESGDYPEAAQHPTQRVAGQYNLVKIPDSIGLDPT